MSNIDHLPDSSACCPTFPPSDTAPLAAVESAVLRLSLTAWDPPVDSDGSPLRIDSVRELATLCSDGPRQAFWRLVVEAAVEDLGHLSWRRMEWERTADRGAAGDALADEINLLIQRVCFEETEMVATKSKPKPSLKRAAATAAAPGTDEEPLGELPAAAELSGVLQMIAIDHLSRSPYQTRRPAPAEWLRDSLQLEGQLEPLLVRTAKADTGRHEIISGHTRHQEAVRLGWREIQCRVVECDDATAERLVLASNAKRADLSVVEKAHALKSLVSQYTAQGKSQRELARDIGISQGQISNLTRLLELPQEWHARLISDEISQSAARILAAWTHRPQLLSELHKRITQSKGQLKEHWRPWTDSTVNHEIRREISGLTAPVPSPCPPADWEKLDVEDVPDWNGSLQKRCWNLKLAKRIAGQNIKKLNETRAVERKTPTAKRTDAVSAWKLIGTWSAWYWRRIHDRLQGKLNKADRSLGIAVAFLTADESTVAAVVSEMKPKPGSQGEGMAQLMGLPWCEVEEAYLQVLLRDLQNGAANNCEARPLPLEQLVHIGSRLGINLDAFRPDALFLKDFADSFLQRLAGPCGADSRNLKGNELRERIIDSWRPGWVPQLLGVARIIDGEKPAKSAKKKVK